MSNVITKEEKATLPAPIWLLKSIVEREWYEWYRTAELFDFDEENEDYPEFPEYDVTHAALEILEKAGYKFDEKKGDWK